MKLTQVEAIEEVVKALKTYKLSAKEGCVTLSHLKSLDANPIFVSVHAIDVIGFLRSIVGKNRLILRDEEYFKVVITGVHQEGVDRFLMQVEVKQKGDNYYVIDNVLPKSDRLCRNRQSNYPYGLREISNSPWFNELRKLIYEYNISERNEPLI